MENTIILGPLPSLDLGGGLSLPTYPLFISLLFTGLIFYINKRSFRRDHSGATALDLFLVCVGFGAIGARLVHVFYEEPAYYLANPLKVFYFWQGGFVFYGGLLSGLVAGWVALKVKQQSFPHWLDFFTPVVSLGYAGGRIACFLAGCCYGKLCDLPWAVSLRELNLDTGVMTTVHRHPTQLYASALEFALFFLVLHFEKKNIFKKRPGHLFLFWLALHSLTRAGLETLRDDNRGPMLAGMSISMLVSLLMASTAIFLLTRGRRSASS